MLSASDECNKMELCGAVPQEGQNVKSPKHLPPAARASYTPVSTLSNLPPPPPPSADEQGEHLPLRIVDNLLRAYDINVTSRLHTDPVSEGRATRDVNGTYLLDIQSNQARLALRGNNEH